VLKFPVFKINTVPVVYRYRTWIIDVQYLNFLDGREDEKNDSKKADVDKDVDDDNDDSDGNAVIGNSDSDDEDDLLDNLPPLFSSGAAADIVTIAAPQVPAASGRGRYRYPFPNRYFDYIN
jgi:hypothetical protein